MAVSLPESGHDPRQIQYIRDRKACLLRRRFEGNGSKGYRVFPASA